MSSCSGCWFAGCCFDPHNMFQVVFSPSPTLSRRYLINTSKDFLSFASNSSDLHVSLTGITSLKLRPGATPTGSLRGELQGLLAKKIHPISSCENHLQIYTNLLCFFQFFDDIIWGARETHRDIFCSLEYLPLLLRERAVQCACVFSSLFEQWSYFRSTRTKAMLRQPKVQKHGWKRTKHPSTR